MEYLVLKQKKKQNVGTGGCYNLGLFRPGGGGCNILGPRPVTSC